MERDLINFRNIAFNLFNTTDDIFERFFEKLYNMDKEYLYIYLVRNRDKITKSQMLFAKNYYERRTHYYDWNLKEIYVCNSRKVSNFLGFSVESDTDLLMNDKCIDFIIKYNNYFDKADINNFKTFTNETGLNLTNIYYLNNCLEKNAFDIINDPKRNMNLILESNPNRNFYSITFNILGSSFDRCFNKEIYNHDLLVTNCVDEIRLKNNNIIIDSNNVYTFNNDDVISSHNHEALCREIRYKLSIANKLMEQINVIKNEYKPKYSLKEDVKQIYLSSFQELFILYNDGNLYKDGKLYATDVLTIWEANSYTSYLIFNNYDVEYVSNHRKNDFNQHFDKVIFNNFYIAFLKNNKVEVINRSEDNINYHTFFYNVDDIAISLEEVDIDLIKGNNKITHSTSSFYEKY